MGCFDDAKPALTALPVACTLNAADLKERVASIQMLTRNALVSFEQKGLALRLRYKPEAATQVRAMVAGEQQCCAFLQFEVRGDENGIEVFVTAPESARDAAGELGSQFTRGAQMKNS